MGDAKTDTTTTEVRDRFCRDLFENADWPVPQSRKEFDRWLATVRADAWDEGHTAGWESRHDDATAGYVPSGVHESDAVNPYRAS